MLLGAKFSQGPMEFFNSSELHSFARCLNPKITDSALQAFSSEVKSRIIFKLYL